MNSGPCVANTRSDVLKFVLLGLTIFTRSWPSYRHTCWDLAHCAASICQVLLERCCEQSAYHQCPEGSPQNMYQFTQYIWSSDWSTSSQEYSCTVCRFSNWTRLPHHCTGGTVCTVWLGACREFCCIGLIIKPCASYLAARNQRHWWLHCKFHFDYN